MNIFTDAVSTVGKFTLSKILMYVFLFACVAYVTHVGVDWLSNKFSTEPTRDQLITQNTQQNAVIEVQAQALDKKDETIALANDLSQAAIESLETNNNENVKAVTKQTEIVTNVQKASDVFKAQYMTDSHFEKDEIKRKQKLIQADEQLAQALDMEIDKAYQLAIERSHL